MKNILRACAANSFMPQLNGWTAVFTASEASSSSSSLYLEKVQLKVAGVELGCISLHHDMAPVLVPEQMARSEIHAGE